MSIVTIGPHGYIYAYLRIDNTYIFYSVKKEKRRTIFYTIDIQFV